MEEEVPLTRKQRAMRLWSDNNTKAVLLGSLSGIFVAVTNFCVKLSSEHHMKTFQILLIISGGNLLLASSIALYRKQGFCFERKDALYLACRSLVMTGARMFYYIAIARLPVFDAETIKNTRSVFTLVFLVITCQERLGFVEFSAGFITFTGVVFVCKPTMIFGGAVHPIDVMGVIFALLSAMCHAMGYLFTKKIPDVHYTVMNFYEFLLHGIGSTILIFALKEEDFPTDYYPYLIVALATCSLFSTTALQIVALSYGSAAIVAITINMNVPALFAIQAIVQGLIPSYLTIIGSILVLGGVFMVSFRNKLHEKLGNCTERLCRRNYESIEEGIQ